MDWQNKYDVKALADECYPVVSDPYLPDATHEQKTSLFRKWKENDQGMSWGDFFSSALPAFHGDGAIAVKWCGMWLCIETDGYCHS